ncbi:MAG TPA: helix-turn-helix domain-containing protein [Terriglobales bacterium]|jgi:excisionase family DNA binding protein|nr:helix-turn-helix domain-containing protein [Terriglobales bacterium]
MSSINKLQSFKTDAMSFEPFVTSDEAARFLSLHPKTVERWARAGRIPGHPVGYGSRKQWRFLLSELQQWMKSEVISDRYPCRVNKGEKLV